MRLTALVPTYRHTVPAADKPVITALATEVAATKLRLEVNGCGASHGNAVTNPGPCAPSAVMFSTTDNKYQIYKLNWPDKWVRTPAAIDDRPTSRF